MTPPDESFIPYSMIEPLLEEGMTLAQLGAALLSRLGLSGGEHFIVTTTPGATSEMPERLKSGVRVLTRQQRDAMIDAGLARATRQAGAPGINAKREPRVAPRAPERDESFIPWAMIEPLLVKGMTGQQLGERIFELTGFTRPAYTIQCAPGSYSMGLMEALRRGVRIRKSSDVSPGPGFANEPVR